MRFTNIFLVSILLTACSGSENPDPLSDDENTDGAIDVRPESGSGIPHAEASTPATGNGQDATASPATGDAAREAEAVDAPAIDVVPAPEPEDAAAPDAPVADAVPAPEPEDAAAPDAVPGLAEDAASDANCHDEAPQCPLDAGAAACGLNGRGTQLQLCIDGGSVPSACADPDQCIDHATSSTACGTNGRGIRVRECVQGRWVDGLCSDPDSCRDGAQETAPCGLNARGTQPRTCAAGHWAVGTCSDSDECRDGATTDAACGRNSRGTLHSVCSSGHWLNGSCQDVDACLDGQMGQNACGWNDRGVLSAICELGQWKPSGAACRDPDECKDGATVDAGCGMNGRGTRRSTCMAGHWFEAACADTDVCVDGKTGTDRCGMNLRGHLATVCELGQWKATTGVCIETDECKDGTSETLDCARGNLPGSQSRTCTSGRWSYTVCERPVGPCAGDVQISTPEEARFVASCTEITGNLVITRSANSWQSSAVELARLARVTGAVRFDASQGNYDIFSEIRLPVLKEVGGDVSLAPGFAEGPIGFLAPALEQIGGNFKIVGSRPQLTTIDLTALKAVAGNFHLGGPDCEYGTFYLKDLAFVRSLSHVGGSLVISSNGMLTSLHGLENLTSIGRDLVISYNNGLKDLEPLSGLVEIPGNVVLGNSARRPVCFTHSEYYFPSDESLIRSLSGLRNVRRIGGALTIADTHIDDYSTLSSLESVGGTITIEENQFTAPTGAVVLPESLTKAGGLAVDIIYMDRLVAEGLVDLFGPLSADTVRSDSDPVRVRFPRLRSTSGSISLSSYPTPIDPFFPSLEVVGGLEIDGVCKRSAQAFPALSEVRGQINLPTYTSDDDQLGLSDFESLRTVSGSVLLGISTLNRLDGFSTLESVGGTLSLSSSSANRELTEITGFGTLMHAGQLTVQGLPNLRPCWIEDLAARIWPDGNANLRVYNTPVCVRR